MAAGLRFWQLGQIPPGLYRDEAFNGLDAADILDGQRGGENPFYFSANNGREPAYIWLTAATISILGQTPLAVRLGAAIVGTLTTFFVYELAKTWFDQRTGLLAAGVWAITVWPIHLSRIGLRPILLPLMFTLTLWLGTLAYRRSLSGRPATWLWLLAGAVYGASFYTYLAVRFTPIFFILFLIYLGLTQRRAGLWPGIGFFALGTAVILTPLAVLAWQQPDMILGRPGQVSVFNTAINGGDPLGTLWRNGWKALGLFFVKGDTIVRHNPPGRAVFDLFMILPFLIGLVWCVRNWRRAPAMTLLLWTMVMLGPTILAEDTPHFLRAVGILPAAVLFPALGLSQIWTWSKLPGLSGPVLAIALLVASLALTVKDYFIDYSRQPATAYWFEDAARDLAEHINTESANVEVFIDQRYWEGWPSVRFLLQPEAPVFFYRSGEAPVMQINPPAAVYAWPYEGLEAVTAGISTPALVSGQTGSLAQGDLEPEPYPLYVHYTVNQPPALPILANFDNAIQLRQAEVTNHGDRELLVELFWSFTDQNDSDSIIDRPLIAFVHVVGPDGVVGQSDSVPSQGNWPSPWWRPGLIVHDQHVLELENDYNANQHQILIGLYIANTGERLMALDLEGVPIGDSWLLKP